MPNLLRVNSRRITIAVLTLGVCLAMLLVNDGPLAIALALVSATGWGFLRYWSYLQDQPQATSLEIDLDNDLDGDGLDLDLNEENVDHVQRLQDELLQIRLENQPLWRQLIPVVIPEIVTVVAIILITLGTFQAAIRLPEPMGPVAMRLAAWPHQRAELYNDLQASYNEGRYTDTFALVESASKNGLIDNTAKLGWIMALTYTPANNLPEAIVTGYCHSDGGATTVTLSITAGVIQKGEAIFDCGSSEPTEIPDGSSAQIIATGIDNATGWNMAMVSVVNSTGGPVNGLEKANFMVLAGNQAQEFTFSTKASNDPFWANTYEISWFGDQEITILLIDGKGTPMVTTIAKGFATTR